ncbi:MAG: hypothetical protein CME63_15925 [Halobacteriovoraceae bacterium]|nr:hypothetical protein [Halobacteriovoraceae bacterium]|tara:strand:+ start:817 stop:1452 length:636 start_codon:yes stop_codon:yes gene_type:complete
MKLKFLLCFIFLLNGPTWARSKLPALKIPNLKIKSFETDGCSAYPDGNPFTSTHEWLHCCIAHDMRYWIGGTLEQKKFADEELGKCIKAETTPGHGDLMEAGVAIGGSAHFPTGWRWGYGWNRLMPYQKLSSRNTLEVATKFDSILHALNSEKQKGHINYRQVYYLIIKYEELREEFSAYREVNMGNDHKMKEESLDEMPDRTEFILDLLN